MKALSEKCTKGRWLALSALFSSPFIIFIITSVELYLNNKVELDYQLITLAPFFVLFAIVVAIGYLIYSYSRKSKFGKILLYAYYLAGPAFLACSLLRQVQLMNALEKSLLISVLFFSALLLIFKKADVLKITKFFSWLSLILIISELLTVFNNIGRAESNAPQYAQTNIPAQEYANKNLPNIYHIIFDEYQTDMFDLTLNKETADRLAGFTYYPKTKTVYGRTGMSLPSIFTGRSYDYKTPQIEYQKQAFNSDKSILFWLKKAGYSTDACIHKVYTFDMMLFDSVVEHKNNAVLEIDNNSYTKTFFDLWVYANVPKLITGKIIKTESLYQIKNQNVLSKATPIVSCESFKNISKNERLLNRPNLYLFVHLIMPHFPYVLKADGSYDSNPETSPLEQSKCATKLMVDFVDTLKRIDRFDNSLIIIQSDHGCGFKVENDDLIKINGGFYSEQWSLARAKALLLIKTPGRNIAGPMHVSDAETSLLDIAPTMAEASGIEAGMNFEGVSLVNPKPSLTRRKRYYHFFDKKGPNEQTDELSRYIINGDKIRFEKTISLNQAKTR